MSLNNTIQNAHKSYEIGLQGPMKMEYLLHYVPTYVQAFDDTKILVKRSKVE